MTINNHNSVFLFRSVPHNYKIVRRKKTFLEFIVLCIEISIFFEGTRKKMKNMWYSVSHYDLIQGPSNNDARGKEVQKFAEFAWH